MTDVGGQTTLFDGRLDGRPLYATVDAIGQRWWGRRPVSRAHRSMVGQFQQGRPETTGTLEVRRRPAREGEAVMPAPLDPERRRYVRSAMKYLTVGGGEEGAFACDVLALLDECDRLREVVERVEGLAEVWESDADGLYSQGNKFAAHGAGALSRAARNLRSALAAAPEQGGE